VFGFIDFTTAAVCGVEGKMKTQMETTSNVQNSSCLDIKRGLMLLKTGKAFNVQHVERQLFQKYLIDHNNRNSSNNCNYYLP